MIRTPQLPGFLDPIQGAQSTFRQLLTSLSYPGRVQLLSARPSTPEGLGGACGAIGLTLFDAQTQIWLQPLTETKMLPIQIWLQFHTGCQFTLEPQTADFAIIFNPAQMPTWDHFKLGTATDPEDSTTVLIQVQHFNGGEAFQICGPGIKPEYESLPLKVSPSSCVQALLTRPYLFPLGIDVILITEESCLGLPRTTQLQPLTTGH